MSEYDLAVNSLFLLAGDIYRNAECGELHIICRTAIDNAWAEIVQKCKEITDDKKHLQFKNNPKFCPECECVLNEQGKCVNSQCNQNQRLL